MGGLLVVGATVVALPLAAPGQDADVVLPPGTPVAAAPGEPVPLRVSAGGACAGMPLELEHRYRAPDGARVLTSPGTVGPDGVVSLVTNVPADALRSDVDLVPARGLPGATSAPAQVGVRIPGCDTSWSVPVLVQSLGSAQAVTASPATAPRGEPVTVTSTGCLGGGSGTLAGAPLEQVSYDGRTWVGRAAVPADRPATSAGPVTAQVVCGQSTGTDSTTVTDVPAEPGLVLAVEPARVAPGGPVTVRALLPERCAGQVAELVVSATAVGGQQREARGSGEVRADGALVLTTTLPLEALPAEAPVRVTTPAEAGCGNGTGSVQVLPRATDQRTQARPPVALPSPEGEPQVTLRATSCFGRESVLVRPTPSVPFEPARVLSVVRAPGQVDAVVVVPGLPGDDVEFLVVCPQSTGQRDVVVSIAGDAALGLVTEQVSVAEAAGAVEVVLERLDDEARPVTVEIGTRDGTATAGSDYAPLARSLTFAAGQRRASVTVSLLADDVAEGTEAFSVEVLDAPLDVLITQGATQVSVVDATPGGVPAPPVPAAPEAPATPAPALSTLPPQLPFTDETPAPPSPTTAAPVPSATADVPADVPAEALAADDGSGRAVWPWALLVLIGGLAAGGTYVVRRADDRS